jgi:hypothetical protein
VRRSSIIEPWREDFILSGEVVEPAQRAALYRSAARGELARVRRGVFMAAERWRRLDAEDRHLAQLRATALVDPGIVVTHLSAAMLWGLPLVDAPPRLPQVVIPRASGGRSSSFVQRIGVGVPDRVDMIDGLQVTPVERTLVDVAAAYDATVSVPILDAALAGRRRGGGTVGRESLGVDGLLSGARRAAFAIAFADERAGSAGESVSRVSIHRAGLEAPDLQVTFSDADGQAGIVDFWWEGARVIGEFDGEGKYRRDLAGRGRDAADLVIAEKWREDRLRASGAGVVRWGWRTARSTEQLRARLVRAGVRVR